jgi:hypothetical protein
MISLSGVQLSLIEVAHPQRSVRRLGLDQQAYLAVELDRDVDVPGLDLAFSGDLGEEVIGQHLVQEEDDPLDGVGLAEPLSAADAACCTRATPSPPTRCRR